MSDPRVPENDPRGPASWPVLLLLRALSYVACVLPAPVVYGLVHLLAAAAFLHTVAREPRQARRRRGALRNMRIAFGPALDRAAQRRLAWRYALHAAFLSVEALRLPLLTARRVRRRVDMRELEEPVFAKLRAGQGVICATGHIGNWEVLGVAAATEVRELASLARPCAEPGLQRWLVGVRQQTGQQVLSKFGGLWPVRKLLQRGGAVGLNMDENTRHGPVFVPFCGVLAASNPSAFHLQRTTGAPIVVLTCHRVGLERFRARVWAVIPPPDRSLPPDEACAAVTGAVARGFEQALAYTPEQYLWGLRRWETRPPGEPEADDGMPARVGPPLSRPDQGRA